MEHLKEFERTSKKEWSVKAIKDLKAEDLSSLDWEIFEGTVSEGYFNSEDDHEYEYVSKFFADIQPPTWLLYEHVKVENEAIANSQILHALENGCNGVILDFEKCEDTEPKVLFQNILLDICHISFVGQMKTVVAEKLNSFLKEKPVLTGFDGGSNIQTSKHRTTVIPLDKGNFISTTSKALEIYKKELVKGTLPSKIAFSIQLGTEFYQELIRIRSLRMMTWLIARDLNISASPSDTYIHSETSPGEKYTDTILSNSSSGLAAIVAGANSICFNLESDKSEDFNKRISRNTGNILREESKLVFENDPVSGNYFIDRYTHILNEKIWDNLQND